MNLNYKSWFRQYGFMEYELDQVNADGEYALILASLQGRYDLLQHLLQKGIDIDCLDHNGNNAIWAACHAESEVCCRLLAKNECEVNNQNYTGETALIYAASHGQDLMVRLLLQLGANPDLKNQDGLTAIDLATTITSLKFIQAART